MHAFGSRPKSWESTGTSADAREFQADWEIEASMRVSMIEGVAPRVELRIECNTDTPGRHTTIITREMLECLFSAAKAPPAELDSDNDPDEAAWAAADYEVDRRKDDELAGRD